MRYSHSLTHKHTLGTSRTHIWRWQAREMHSARISRTSKRCDTMQNLFPACDALVFLVKCTYTHNGHNSTHSPTLKKKEDRHMLSKRDAALHPSISLFVSGTLARMCGRVRVRVRARMLITFSAAHYLRTANCDGHRDMRPAKSAQDGIQLFPEFIEMVIGCMQHMRWGGWGLWHVRAIWPIAYRLGCSVPFPLANRRRWPAPMHSLFKCAN